MELREEDLRGAILGAGRLAREGQGEGRVAEVEAVGEDFARGGEGAGPHVGFGGAEAGVRGEGGGAGGGHGGGGERGFQVGGCDGGVAVGGAGVRVGGGGVVEGEGGCGGGAGGVVVGRGVRGEGERFVVEGEDREVFAVPVVAPFVVVLGPVSDVYGGDGGGGRWKVRT